LARELHPTPAARAVWDEALGSPTTATERPASRRSMPRALYYDGNAITRQLVALGA
jgi:hypothetical protein